ncbi:MAG: transcriptional regulator, partial [Rhodobacteraceae bacterium]|nr:transcriptional regulator [Paracoccaceae bacterium]
LERIEEFVGRFPGWAALLAGRQARIGQLERVVESYAERMAQDPFLLTSLHEVLSAVTSLRS